MTFALTCALCLASPQLGAGLGASIDATPSALAAALESPIPAGPAHPSLALAGAGDGWYQHDHGDSAPQDESGHGGHSMMGTTMIVVMVAMMVVVGGLFMMRGARAAASPQASGPAALAIPVTAPVGPLAGG